MSHIVRVEVKTEGGKRIVTFFSTKTGGQDRTFVEGADAEIVENWLEESQSTKKAIKTKK
jgi:hypothetical protein